MEKLLTPEEVASKLIVSPKTVRDWLREGTIKGVKVGKLWRIREADLESFIASNGTKEDASFAKEPQPAYSYQTHEDKTWLEANLSGPLPPYDWGPEGPPKTKPIIYIPGKGFVVKGGKENGS